jgi:2TM domain
MTISQRRPKEEPVMSESSNDALEEARRYVRRKRIFYTVLGIWIALSLVWFTIDLLDDSSSFWFYWPMLGTGIGVAITGLVLLGVGGIFGVEWERREIDRYLRRRGTS